MSTNPSPNPNPTTATSISASKVAWPYPVGIIGQPWTQEHIQQWRTRANQIQRSYQEEVVSKLQSYMKKDQEDKDEKEDTFNLNLSNHFDLVQYGSLSQNPDRYPLYLLQTTSDEWKNENPTVLITGGVHGYETSGVQGALLFLRESLSSYRSQFNFIVVPCVSPWGYETIQRWSINAVDVNRSFVTDGPSSSSADVEKDTDGKDAKQLGSDEGRTEESAQLMDWLDANLKQFGGRDCIKVHLDLHETTDTDATEFRPAKMSRGGVMYNHDDPDNKIPEGFYLVGNDDSEHDVRSPFCRAIVDKVSEVTKICRDQYILGLPSEAPDGSLDHDDTCTEAADSIGVIYVSAKSLGLCAGMTNADLAVTTEVYPDAVGVTSEECDKAQQNAIIGALDYYLASKINK